jgi:CDP-diacylglycerol---serine O-phosphatidyltransferase
MTHFYMSRHIPNIITMGNLFLGCCAIVFVLSGQHEQAVYCLLGCFACDYADGMIARALQVNSPLGKELDSLADVVSFGVVPGMFLYTVLTRHFCPSTGEAAFLVACGKSSVAFLLSACAALRLGKFNLDTRQTTYFLGLSTPATTVFVVGICMAILTGDPKATLFDSPLFLLPAIVVLCYLMLSEIKLLGFKINPKKLGESRPTFIGLALAAALIYAFGYLGAALSIVAYLVGSWLYFAANKNESAHT